MDDMAGPGFEGAKFVCSPPLRTADHQEDLWKGLRGDDLQVVSTDHAPFNYVGQKDLGKDDFSKIPNGLPSVEDRFTLLYGGVRGGAHRAEPVRRDRGDGAGQDVRPVPAQGHDRAGLGRGHRGVRPDASNATISAKTHHMNVDYSAYEGRKVRGLPETVLQRGQVLVQDGAFHGKPGQGRFLPRSRISV